MELFNDDLEIFEVIEHGFPRKIYERSNHFDNMDNLTFFRRFRLTKPTVLSILEEIEDQLEFPDDRNNSVDPMNRLLTCLRLYATGGHLSTVADFMGMDPGTTSRIVRKVSEVLAGLRHRYIKMPDAGEELISVQNKFFQMHSFPRVLGCIDGTHIRIQSPGGDDPEVFRNRKGFFSINTQVVGDADLKIRDVVARWPGSSHDQTIFINSLIRARIENQEFPNSVLLGDSGYGLRNYLLTPLGDPRTAEEQLYNESHIRTRNSIERIFGVWKRRFPILAYGIRLKLSTALAVIPATAVLHNIAREMNEDEPPADDVHNINYLVEMGNIPEVLPNNYNLNAQAGQRILFRNEVINYFANVIRQRNINQILPR